MQRYTFQRLGNSQSEGFANFLQYSLSDTLSKLVFSDNNHQYFEHGPIKHDMYFGSVKFFVYCYVFDLFCLAYPDVKAKLNKLATVEFDSFCAGYREKKKYSTYSPLDYLNKLLANDKTLSCNTQKKYIALSEYTTSLSDRAKFVRAIFDIMLNGFFEISHAEEIQKYLDKLNKETKSDNSPVNITSRKMLEELYDIAVKRPGSDRRHHLVDEELNHRTHMIRRSKEEIIEAYVKSEHSLVNYLLTKHLDRKEPEQPEQDDFIFYSGRRKSDDPEADKVKNVYNEISWLMNVATVYKFGTEPFSLSEIQTALTKYCKERYTQLCNKEINDTLVAHAKYDKGPEMNDDPHTIGRTNYIHLRYDYNTGACMYHKTPANETLRAEISRSCFHSHGVSSVDELIKLKTEEAFSHIKHDINDNFTIEKMLNIIVNQAARTLLLVTPTTLPEGFAEKFDSAFNAVSDREVIAHLATLELKIKSHHEPVQAIEMIKEKYLALVNTFHPDKMPYNAAEARQYIINITRSYAVLIEHFQARINILKPANTIAAKAAVPAEDNAKTHVEPETAPQKSINPLMHATSKAENEAAALLALMESADLSQFMAQDTQLKAAAALLPGQSIFADSAGNQATKMDVDPPFMSGKREPQ